jgi:hypothetical protein
MLQDARCLSYSVSGSLDCLETDIKSPTIKILDMMVEPPYEINGRGLPERGRRPKTPPMLTKAWMINIEVQPAAISLPVKSGA